MGLGLGWGPKSFPSSTIFESGAGDKDCWAGVGGLGGLGGVAVGLGWAGLGRLAVGLCWAADTEIGFNEVGGCVPAGNETGFRMATTSNFYLFLSSGFRV